MNERDVFIAARLLATADQRRDYLDSACEGDAPLRARVEELLEAHDQAGSFLQHPAVDIRDTVVTGDSDSDASLECGDRTLFDASEIPLDFLSPPDEPGCLGRIGSYKVGEVIGSGGMGIVLKAHDAKLNRVVAVKVLAPKLAGNATARRRFVREAQAAAAIAHPHIVTIFAVDEDRLPYLVMEFVNGVSLQEKIDREGQLELREILRIGNQIASGLSAAHAQGVIHRDIKPANILLENGVERVRITDFGLARAVDDVDMTRTGEVAGTPQYMSPEQAQGNLVDARSDLFSLGSVLYAMCTGRSPFRADTTMGCLRRVCDDSPRPIREINPDAPEWLVAIIARLLQKDAAARFQTAREVAELLGRHLAHVQNPGSAPLPSTATSPLPQLVRVSQRRRQRWLTAALILAALGIALGTTEATGVTSVSATVVRIVTGEGILVIELDDPSVNVSLDGEELRITGAGLHELRLRPGSYQLQADRNGLPVSLDQELVTVSRGGRIVVRVKLEGVPAPAEPAHEQDAFVLLAAGGERAFDTLSEAVLRSSAGDTIEIRGNGPFTTTPITIGRSLLIRAATGFRPVIRMKDGETASLISSSSGLVLEGLELQCPAPLAPASSAQAFDPLLRSNSAPIALANCRLIGDGQRTLLQCWPARSSVIRNCELLNAAADTVNLAWDTGGGLTIDNTIIAAPGVGRAAYMRCWRLSPEFSLRISRTTSLMRGWGTIGLSWETAFPVQENASEPRETPVRIELMSNVFDESGEVVRFRAMGAFLESVRDQTEQQRILLLPQLIAWREQHNLYVNNELFQWLLGESGPRARAETIQRSEWATVFQLEDTQSVLGDPKFEGGDLRARLAADPHSLKPEDFRLRADSPGYRAGPDGKDLGPDIDLVGPGAAYERWNRTPEYGQWLEETRPLQNPSAQDLVPSTEWAWTQPVNLGSSVNSEHWDSHPWVSADGLQLILASGRPGGRGRHDLWQCTRESTADDWNALVSLGDRINTEYMDLAPFLSDDGLTLFVTSDRPGGQGHWDIWSHQRETQAAEWSEAVNLGAPINGPTEDSHPFLTPDGLIMLFQSDRPGGQGDCDLWISRRSSTANNWSEPVPVGAAVNSTSKEGHPCLSSDGLCLYFSSDRPGGAGGVDVWMSRGVSPFGPWTEPINLGPIVNDASNDYAARLSGSDDCLYFESGRFGKLGGHDIWMSTRVAKLDYVQRAQDHVSQGRMDEAAADFAVALSLCTSQSMADAEWNRIATRVVASDELFDRVIALRPQSINLWSYRGGFLENAGRWEEASACYRTRLELGPDGTGLWYHRAVALLALNDLVEYRAVCEEMLAKFADVSDPQEAWFAAWPMAIAPDSVADTQRALDMAERAMHGLPDAFYGARAYAAWLYRIGRLEESIAVWEGAGQRDWEEVRVPFLAMAHHRLGHAEQALQYAEQATASKSEWSKIMPMDRRAISDLLVEQMETVLAAAPDMTVELRLESAARGFDQALKRVEAEGNDPAERQRIVNQFLPSDELFARVVALRPQDVALWAARGHHLAEEDRWEAASACFAKRLELAPDGSGRWHCYALTLLAANDTAGYRRVCEEMLVLFAGISDPKEAWWVAWVTAIGPDAVNDEQQAFGLAERSMSGLPDEPYGARGYAAWLYRLGRLEESIACWENAGRQDDGEVRACFLAMAHHRLGHAEQALQYKELGTPTTSVLASMTPWYRRLVSQRLMHEMETVLAGEPDALGDPRTDNSAAPTTPSPDSKGEDALDREGSGVPEPINSTDNEQVVPEGAE